MEIKYRDIVLRDMVESDIEDWIRWYTVETEWGDWDAPDEPMQDIDPEEYRKEMEQLVRTPQEGFRSFFELATADGNHIGAVCSYAIGSDFQWMSWPDAHELGTFCHTIGVDICDSRFWGRGLGTQAIAACAFSTSALNPSGSVTAMSARTLRFRSMPATLRPCMKLL